MQEFSQGSRFELAGQLLVDGAASDFDQCTLQAAVTDLNGALIATLDCEWLDQSQGVFTMKCEDTTAWPLAKLALTSALLGPNGMVFPSTTEYFRMIKVTIYE